jgi:ferredoxin
VVSPYDILGIDRDADEETIQQAYRERVKETHPDQGGSVRAFQRVKAAYEAIVSGVALDGDVADFDTFEAEEEGREPDRRVEYLNYEVLDDHGWSIDDPDLFENARAADLPPVDYGRFVAPPNDTLLEAAEERGYRWPFSCRGGACANCAVAVVSGELSTPVNHVLTDELIDRGIRLSCVGRPITDEVQVVYNVKHLPDVEELLLPPGPFEWSSRDR